MTGRFGKYGDAKRRLKMQKARKAAHRDLPRGGAKRPAKATRQRRGSRS
jgi:hypothetical protein